MRVLLLTFIMFSNLANADSYVFLRGKIREFSTTPCESMGLTTINRVASSPTSNATAPAPTADVYTQLENIKRNRQEIAAKYDAPVTAQKQLTRSEKVSRCTSIPLTIKGIEQQIRAATTYNTVDMLRGQIQELESEYRLLGC